MTVQGKQSVVRRGGGAGPSIRPMKSEELVPAAQRIAPLLIEDEERHLSLSLGETKDVTIDLSASARFVTMRRDHLRKGMRGAAQNIA